MFLTPLCSTSVSASLSPNSPGLLTSVFSVYPSSLPFCLTLLPPHYGFVSLCLPLWPISLSLSAPLRDLVPSPLHFCLFPIPVPSLSLHLSISPPSTRPRFGSGCVTFTRPFSAAVSTETSSGAGEGGDRKQTHPFPPAPGPSASRPLPPPPLGFLTSSLGGWGVNVFSRNTGLGSQTTEGGLREVHTCT